MKLGGATEVAALLGVSRQRLNQLRARPGFPEPVGEIAAGSIWDLETIERWSDSGLRRSSGRPRQQVLLLADRYVLDEEPIASGGFADVYRATNISKQDHEPNAVVAIKLLRNFEDTEIRRRFQRELRLVADCSHPNVVRVLDQGQEEGGRLWYAMPLATGSLMDAIDRFPGNDDRIAQVMGQVCAGVSFVHERGIYHRDLKPPNILRVGHDTWAISDFGLAREEERRSTVLTSTLQGVGTFFFAAPEAWRSAREAEAPADIFSLGKILHCLVIGELPISSEPPAGIYRHIIQKATRERPDDRYSTVDDFMAALTSASTTPPHWQAAEEREGHLADELSLERPDLGVVLNLLDTFNRDPRQTIEEVGHAIPRMSRAAIELAWHHQPEDFKHLIRDYGRHVEESSFGFEFCDVIANFFERAVVTTTDPDVLTAALKALVELGYNHNRWHVQGVVTRLLQDIRDAPTALAASDALRECNRGAIEWTVSEFAGRSLHPALRRTIDNICGSQQQLEA